LLRGIIDIILENSPYIETKDGRINVPLGLMIEKWLIYYYPILDADVFIPQINGETNLAFDSQFRLLVDAYKERGGFSAFFNDLKCKSIPVDIQPVFMKLVVKLKSTITRMPMKYIGNSVNNLPYSIFNFSNLPKTKSSKSVDVEYLIDNFGIFSIPVEYYEAFRFLGRFIGGQDSILFKWAEFSVSASGGSLGVENVLHHVLRSPVTDREVLESKKIYQRLLSEEGEVRCVWTNKLLNRYDIDHVIPFSVWKNNDLWNLLPSSPQINNAKRDRIPSSGLIEQQSGYILHYWDLLNLKHPERFHKEIKVALLGKSSDSEWQLTAIERLKQSCEYLITSRGYESWGG
jgi:hypothetical protein